MTTSAGPDRAEAHPTGPARTVGVDIGGVLSAHTTREDDTSFWTDRYLESPEVAGAFDGVRALVEDGWTVQLVSKCGRRTERKTRDWLRHHDLSGRTGVTAWNVWFCEERPAKAEIASVLHLDAFVDDRLDVLDLLPRRVRTRLWFDPPPGGGEPAPTALVPAIPVPDWAAVTAALTGSDGR